MTMKGDTVLDFVELQLAPPRTRCDLFVSANGVTEKLSSGFLKLFLSHLRAVEEQVARGCSCVRLGHPKSLNGNSWFTKGTLERFVRFVSTPEVLERVKSVEDELAQLEQVRTIQASSIFQAEDIFVDEVPARSDGKVHHKVLEEEGSFKLPRRKDDDIKDSGAEASKIELLRAMDLRLLTLQQEQSTVFERAVAAGFSSENLADLIAFSDHFGAERLRTACVNFLAVLKTRHEKFTQSDSQAASNCSSMNLQSVSSGDDKFHRHDKPDGSHHPEDERMEYSDTILTSATTRTRLNNLSSRMSGGVEVRKRWGPPENIRTELFMDQNEAESASSGESSNGTSVRGSPDVQSLSKKNNREQSPLQNIFTETVSCPPMGNLGNASSVGNVVSAGYTNSSLIHSSEYQADGKQEESSPFERSSMSFSNIQSNSAVLNCTHEPSHKEKTMAVSSSSNSSEGNKSKDSAMGFETSSTLVVTSTRRLSVQDAISLFENKQRRDSIDSVGKCRTGKQENGRTSLGGAGTSFSGTVTLRKWDSGKSPESGNGLQENGFLFKPEVGASASRSVVSGSLVPSDTLQARHRASLAQSMSGSLAKASSNTQCQPSISCVSAKVEGTINEHSTSSGIVTDVCDGDWRKQFKLQLEKSLAKDCFTRESLVEDNVQEYNLGISMPEKKIDLPKETGPSASIPFVGSRSRKVAESGVLLESRQLLPLPDTAGLNTARGQNGSEKSELCLPNLDRSSGIKFEEESEANEAAKHLVTLDSAVKQRFNRESLGSSSINPLDHDMQALVILADNQTSEDDQDSGALKGRLYEQYRKLRDAKLMEDQDSKRAEREAKLRMMEETLKRRKAEMDARAVRLSNNSRNQVRSMKVEALESDLHTPMKEKQGDDAEVTETVAKDQAKSTLSPPLTPCTSKEVSNLKPHGGRKGGAVPQKGATPPRSSCRPVPSVSPKVTPRNTTIGAGNLPKSAASRRGENPLARSVPCFANLRKENTKPSPGRPLGSARVHPKSTGRIPGMIDTPPLEPNGNVPARTNFSRSGPPKEEQRNRSALLRKSYATGNEFKTLSTSSDDGILAPRKGQKETTTEHAAYDKLRRSAVGSLQEAKPFLRKGRGIGPGTGLGVVKQKVSGATDTTKSSDEEIMTAQRPDVNSSDGASRVPDAVLDGSISREPSESENMDLDDDVPEDFGSLNHVDVEAMRTMDASQNDNEVELNVSTAVDTPITDTEPLLDIVNDTQRACHTISFPIDMETHNRFAEALCTQSDSNIIFDPDALSLKEEDIEALSQQDENTVGSILNPLDEMSACPSFRATSPPHEHSLPMSSIVPSSPPLTSSVGQYEHLSPPFGAKVELPMGIPVPWISSQVQHTDLTQLDKKWVAFQKPVLASQPKESVKGFKRLLKFGRKSRPSEIAAADCISASTTSEGDDESEEQSRFVDEASSRGRLSDKRYIDVLGDHSQADEEGSVSIAAQCLRSSIPTPPANFKMRDDHMGGGTMLRAPRSFFSLSSFRSKGSEGKSRSREH